MEAQSKRHSSIESQLLSQISTLRNEKTEIINKYKSEINEINNTNTIKIRKEHVINVINVIEFVGFLMIEK